MKRHVTVSILTALGYVVALCLGAPTAGADSVQVDNNLAVLWRTILQTPSPQNPFGTGGPASTCVDLGGILAPFGPNGAGPCTVKPGTKIYVAASTVECSTFPNDGPGPDATEAELLDCARNQDVKVAPQVTVDDKPEPVTEVKTPLLNIKLPADNLFGLPTGTTGQSVGHGWVTLLHPLTPGTHTIKITGSASRPPRPRSSFSLARLPKQVDNVGIRNRRNRFGQRVVGLLVGHPVGVRRQGQHLAAVPEPLRYLYKVDACGEPQRQPRCAEGRAAEHLSSPVRRYAGGPMADNEHYRLQLLAAQARADADVRIDPNVNRDNMLEAAITTNTVRRMLTTADKAARMHACAAMGWSQRKIARAFGVSQPSVSQLMAAYPPPDGAPLITVTQGEDGKTYTHRRRDPRADYLKNPPEPKPPPSPWALDGTSTKAVRRARAVIEAIPPDTDAMAHWEVAALRSELLMLRDGVDAMLTKMEPQPLDEDDG